MTDTPWMYLVCGHCAHQVTIAGGGESLPDRCENCREPASRLRAFSDQDRADDFSEAVLAGKPAGWRP